MGGYFWHIIIVLLVVILVFGTKRLPNVMEDLAKGIKSFKKGLKDEDHKTLAQDKKEDQKAGE
mgnify:CR=1 FL=1